MTIQLPPSGADDFLRALRRKRIRSVLLWSPVIYALITGCTAAFLTMRGHGLLHLIANNAPDQYLVPFIWGGAGVLGLFGTSLYISIMIRECRAIAVPFCSRCQKAQHSFGDTCDQCHQQLTEIRRYVYLSADSEKDLALDFGLRGED